MVDLICTVIFVLAMIAGYLAGGFREIIKVAVMVALMVLFLLPSVKSAFLVFGPAANGAFVVAFVAVYLVASWFAVWVMKGIIESSEGTVGSINKGVGIVAGFVKASLLTVFAAYIVRFLWSKKMLAEVKPYLDDSFIFSAASAVLDFLL